MGSLYNSQNSSQGIHLRTASRPLNLAGVLPATLMPSHVSIFAFFMVAPSLLWLVCLGVFSRAAHKSQAPLPRQRIVSRASTESRAQSYYV